MCTITECYNCGVEIDDEPYKNAEGDDFCCDCWHEEYSEICAICEDSFDKPTGPECHYLTISKDDGEPKYPSGIWKVLEWPFYRTDCIGGGNVFDESIQWVAPLPVYKEVLGLQEIYSGPCCPDCAAQYAGYNHQDK